MALALDAHVPLPDARPTGPDRESRDDHEQYPRHEATAARHHAPDLALPPALGQRDAGLPRYSLLRPSDTCSPLPRKTAPVRHPDLPLPDAAPQCNGLD